MKKLFLCAVMIFLVCGCSNINKMSIDKIASNSVNGKTSHPNVVRIGYKYYKPQLMTIISTTKNNEVLRSNDYLYYLYVDTVSYLNKTNTSYEENDISYYSKRIMHKKKLGYIEINEIKDNQYLIEIMYNYAKIEVMVDKDYIKEAVAYSMSILTSIKYNDTVIKNKLDTHVLSSYEETVDIFKTATTKKNNYLKYEEDKTYDKDVIPDMDLVN
ncbi:MAG: hypothetical protein IKX00_05040 [Bacilli bacterium]|nr:hypothetical protein [Bacilli bacterium]